MINLILLFLFFFLIIFIMGYRGISLMITLFINFSVLLSVFLLISLGFSPIIIGFLSSILLCWIIIYRSCDDDLKRHSSLLAVISTLLFVGLFLIIFTYFSRCYGFGYEALEEINMFSYNIHISYYQIEIAVILLGLVGAIVDASISISSSLMEVHLQNQNLSFSNLLQSGFHIGKDILGTTVNTLFFAFMGDCITLFVMLYSLNYSFLDLINNKMLLVELFKILFSIFGCLIVIPLTIYFCSYFYSGHKLFSKE